MVQIESVKIERMLDKEQRIGNVEILAIFSDEAYEGCYLWAKLLDRKGREVDSIFPLPVEKELGFCMRVSDPVLWNAENAFTYEVVLEVRNEIGECCDSITRKVAFFHWEISDGEVRLNGRTIPFRSRSYPQGVTEEKEFFSQMKREYVNTLLFRPEQKTEYLEELALSYGIYLVVGGEHLEYGKISAELERNPEGYHSEKNPDFSIQVVKDGALIENRSVFINAAQYQLIFEVYKGEELIQKGKLHADIPAGESRYLNIPYMELHDAGKFYYRVMLCLEEDALWEKEGYAIASGETKVSNFFER